VVALVANQRRLKSVYGASDELGRPFVEVNEDGSIKKDPRGWPIALENDFGKHEQLQRLTSGNYSRERMWEERRALREYQADGREIKKQHGKFTAAMKGRDWRSRVSLLHRRIESKKRVIQSTPERINKYDEAARRRRQGIERSWMQQELRVRSRQFKPSRHS